MVVNIKCFANKMIIDKSWYVKPEGIKDRLVAGGVVARKKKGRVFILLLANKNKTEYVLPKGGVEEGEDIVTAAKREISEEAGIKELTLICELGKTERLTWEKDYWSICKYFLFKTDQTEGKQDLQDGEEYEVKWFDIDKLPSIFWPDQEELILNKREEIKSFIVHS